jgi:hypothetical protein
MKRLLLFCLCSFSRLPCLRSPRRNTPYGSISPGPDGYITDYWLRELMKWLANGPDPL